MANPKFAFQEKIASDSLTQEVAHILELLDEIKDHTLNLRKRLLEDLSTSQKNVHLKLDKVMEQ